MDAILDELESEYPEFEPDKRDLWKIPPEKTGWVIAHNAIRGEINTFEEALKNIKNPLQKSQIESIRVWWNGHSIHIHEHHSNEDDVFNPFLRTRINYPDKLESDHVQLVEHMNKIESCIQKISQIVAALCTVAIVSMDLGVSYTKSEQSLYQSFVFQSIAILSVGFSLTNDLTMTVVVYILWSIFKFTKMSFDVKAVDDSGDEVPLESFEDFENESFTGGDESFDNQGDGDEEFDNLGDGDEEFDSYESFQNY